MTDNRGDIDGYSQYGYLEKFHLDVVSYAIELACKKTRNDAHVLRKDAFNGHLKILFDYNHGWEALWRLCSENFAWLRNRVTCIEMVGFSGKQMRRWGRLAVDWPRLHLLGYFPQARTIEVHYQVTKYQYRGGMDNRLITDEWRRLLEPGAHQAFLNGQRDDDFVYPLQSLRLLELYRYMHQYTGQCNIYLYVDMQWKDHSGYSVYNQVSSHSTQPKESSNSMSSGLNFSSFGPVPTSWTEAEYRTLAFQRLKGNGGFFPRRQPLRDGGTNDRCF